MLKNAQVPPGLTLSFFPSCALLIRKAGTTGPPLTPFLSEAMVGLI